MFYRLSPRPPVRSYERLSQQEFPDAMWHVIYLSLINIFIGATSSVVMRRRARWVQRQTELGYDFQRSFPPTFLDRFFFWKSSAVDVEEVCHAIDPDFDFVPNDLLLHPIDSDESEQDNSENGSNDELSDSETVGEQNEGGSGSDQAFEDSNGAARANKGKSSGPESTMEVIDLQQASQDAAEDEENDEESNQVESAVAKELSDMPGMAHGVADTEDTSGSSENSVAESPEETLDRPVGDSESQELDPLNIDTTSDSTSDDHQDEDSAATAGLGHADSSDDETGQDDASEVASCEGDFLQRMASIEDALQSLLDESDGAVSLTLPSQQLLDAATYWDRFQESTQKILDLQKKSPGDAAMVGTIDAVMQQVQEQVRTCQSVAAKTVQGVEGATSEAAGAELRSHILDAAKGSHQLRDQLATGVSFAGLRFENCTPDGLQDYSEGLVGLESVLQAWKDHPEAKFAGLGLIDIDHFDKINRDFGLTMSDIVLARCCQQINTSIRHNRGFDRLVRVGGQQFLIFFGHTSAADVCYALERIRQSFRQTDFEIRGELTHIDIRAAAIDFARDQNPIAHLQKLREGVAKAKELGGNNIVCGSFEDPFYLVEGLPEYELPIRSIEIDDSAVLSG